jgi:hypothetical protein
MVQSFGLCQTSSHLDTSIMVTDLIDPPLVPLQEDWDERLRKNRGTNQR